MPATANRPKAKPVKKVPSLIERCDEYLRKKFPVGPEQILIVSHLWAKNFRIKVYERQNRAINVLVFRTLVSSEFVQVREDESGELTHKVF